MEKDKCVICDKETVYTKDTHINLRCYYVDGTGQLCRKCYNDSNKYAHDNTQ